MPFTENVYYVFTFESIHKVHFWDIKSVEELFCELCRICNITPYDGGTVREGRSFVSFKATILRAGKVVLVSNEKAFPVIAWHIKVL